jgi:hypothetical protein
LLLDIYVGIVVNAVAYPRKDEHVPRGDGNTAQPELAFVAAPRLDFDRSAPSPWR